MRIPAWLVFALLLPLACSDTGQAPAPSEPDPATEAEIPSEEESAAPPETALPPVAAGDLAANLADATLAARLRLALLDTASLQPFDIVAEVRDRRVVLHGTVETTEQRRLAGAIAQEMEGVREVQNRVLLAVDTTRARADSLKAAAN